MNHDKNYDAIIVGGGHNGLVAASYLAKAGKSVLLLEAQDDLGGATTSVKPFPEYEVDLSRYSYLVSLLPDQIVSDLGIRFKTLDRAVASYTPYQCDGKNDGLLVSKDWDQATADSFRRLTGSDHEAKAWCKFYGEIAELAQRFAPSMLQPLKSEAELKSEMGLPEIWRHLMEVPIGEVIRDRFSDDLVRGVVLTDGLIGTFAAADDMQANRCFLYHLIGNGDGQWRVPQGGMGALVKELYRVATAQGVEIKTRSKVSALESGPMGVRVETESGETYTAKDLLFAAAPQLLARLRGGAVPDSLEGAQLKMNMLVTRLPRLKSGMDPRIAFAGTFHINESFSQLEAAYASAQSRKMPQPLPLELYCHTLTDPTILSPELFAKGFHTLTLFGLHTPAKLFDADPVGAKALAKERALASLNDYLLYCCAACYVENFPAFCTILYARQYRSHRIRPRSLPRRVACG
jgi:phytoene dehydrogenase-like protein